MPLFSLIAGVVLIALVLIFRPIPMSRLKRQRENFDKAGKFLTRNLRCPVCGHNRIGQFCAKCGASQAKVVFYQPGQQAEAMEKLKRGEGVTLSPYAGPRWPFATAWLGHSPKWSETWNWQCRKCGDTCVTSNGRRPLCVKCDEQMAMVFEGIGVL